MVSNPNLYDFNLILMKQIIWSIIFILSSMLLNAQTKAVIETSNETFDKLIIDKTFEKRRAVVDYERINMNTEAVLNGKAILDFFGYQIPVYEQKLEVRGLKNYSWLAKDSNNRTFFILTVLEDDIQGVINTGTEMFRIETIDNKYFITKIDQSKYPDENCSNLKSYTNQNQAANNNLYSNNNGGGYKFISGEPFTCRLRVLVLYTPNAIATNNMPWASNPLNIQNTIQLAADQTNQSFINSSINGEIELVYVGLTDYDDSNVDMEVDLLAFANDADGKIDEVHNLRIKHQADVCVLIIGYDNSNDCGMVKAIKADSENAFCVVAVDCAVSKYTFAHEIGHLIGCQHAIHEPTISQATAAYPFAHGYASPDHDWRTIMTNRCSDNSTCIRIPFWSNPNISFGGNPMGLIGTSNNSFMIEDKFPNVMSLLQPNDNLFLEHIDVTAEKGDIIAIKEIENNGIIDINSAQAYSFRAGEKITFKPGFRVQHGSQFTVEIVDVSDCGESDGEPSNYGQVIGDKSNVLSEVPSFDIQLFPNPASDRIIISCKAINSNVADIIITDFIGRELIRLEKVTFTKNKLHKILNISNLSNGFYFVTINTYENKITKKFYKR